MDARSGLFFCLAFGWTWLWQLPMTLGYEGGLWLLFAGLAGIGPSLAAIVLTRGKVLGTLRPRGHARWYLVALAVPPLARALALGGDAVFGQELPTSLITLPFLGALLLPPLGEELGWRGFAYPRMADRMGRARAAVGTGLLWALWHLPTAFWPGARPVDFPLYALAVTGAGIWMAWLYERAQRSTLVAVLAHAAINAGIVASASRASLAVVWAAIGVASTVALASTRSYGGSLPCTREPSS